MVRMRRVRNLATGSTMGYTKNGARPSGDEELKLGGGGRIGGSLVPAGLLFQYHRAPVGAGGSAPETLRKEPRREGGEGVRVSEADLPTMQAMKSGGRRRERAMTKTVEIYERKQLVRERLAHAQREEQVS